mmetsp:Transcript_30858/g.80514  ORF Transcript_30858/g.80514 Transcript_30858/m.80514 type:complete len:84 (-) Transcript_30858:580-831(-)
MTAIVDDDEQRQRHRHAQADGEHSVHREIFTPAPLVQTCEFGLAGVRRAPCCKRLSFHGQPSGARLTFLFWYCSTVCSSAHSP